MMIRDVFAQNFELYIGDDHVMLELDGSAPPDRAVRCGAVVFGMTKAGAISQIAVTGLDHKQVRTIAGYDDSCLP